MRKFLPVAVFVIACLGPSAHAQTVSPGPVPEPVPEADRPSSDASWRILFSPATTYHYHSDPDHRPVWAIGAERETAGGRVIGASYFSNSFGQPCGYVYVGERLFAFADPRFYAQWTAGVIYGYRGEFAHKVPLNYNGFSPGLVLAAGMQLDQRWSAQINVLGTSALMLQFNLGLP